MFLNWTMLAGVAGAAIPLVLHLLAKARYHEVEWGAMMFLHARDVRQSQRSRLRHWALLGVRMAMVGLLAVALARPVYRGKGSGNAPVTAVLVFDRSYSMAFEEAGRSRLDKAKEAALQILGTLRPGDEAALVLVGDGVEVRPPRGELQVVGREVGDLQVSQGAADLAAGLLEARSILDQGSARHRELYLVCDRQALSWRGVEALGDSLKAWSSRAEQLTRFYVVPVGNEDSENIAVESVDMAEGFGVRGQSSDVEVRVRNHANVLRAGVELEIHGVAPGDAPRRGGVAGRLLKKTVITIGPRSSATVRLPVLFQQAGSHVIRAEIRSPGLEVDNQLEAAIDIIDPISVLIISGDERSEAMRRESFFLRSALMPLLGGKPGAFAVTVKSISELPAVKLGDHRVIVLANVPEISLEQARNLEERVYEGGGLIICPGALSGVENYNTVLHRDGLGLMPAQLTPATSPDEAGVTSIQGIDVAHPVFRFTRGTEIIPTATVRRHFPVDTGPSDARAIAHYASGAPFLIEAQRGRGRVLLVTTPLDADWSTLPLSPFYLPFVQSMVKYAALPRENSRNIGMGEPIVAAVEDNVEEAILMRMDEAQNLLPGDVRRDVRFTRTQRPGVYRLAVRQKSGAWKVAHYAVRPPRDESDLAALTDEQWVQHERQLGFTRIEGAGQKIGEVLARQRQGRELWLPMLVLVLALGVTEMWLARRWAARV